MKLILLLWLMSLNAFENDLELGMREEMQKGHPFEDGRNSFIPNLHKKISFH